MYFSLFRCAFRRCTIYTYMYHMHIHAPPNVCMDYHMHIHAPHACTIKGTYMCTIYTYMHHQTHVHNQIPPKYKIYPVGLPSAVYETPGPNERSVLNQLFLVLFIVLFTFQVKTTMLFMKITTLFMKTTTLFIVSFWVITKYRSFIRKTNQETTYFPRFTTRKSPTSFVEKSTFTMASLRC